MKKVLGVIIAILGILVLIKMFNTGYKYIDNVEYEGSIEEEVGIYDN